MQLNFRGYMEAIADFGFDRNTRDPHEGERPERENPIDTFDIEFMTEMLQSRELGSLRPSSRFVNEVTWGSGIGSIRLWVDPKTGVYMNRLGTDLGGEPRWYTKKYYQINRHGYGGFEEVVTQELFDRLVEVQKQPIDSPVRDYKGLKSLLIAMVERLRKDARPIFLFDKVTKMDEYRYLIAFNLRGQGVQAPGQKRVEKNVTDLSYDPEAGTIRVMNYNYESPLGEHKWEVSGPDLDLIYFPTQPRDEIIGPVATSLRFY